MLRVRGLELRAKRIVLRLAAERLCLAARHEQLFLEQSQPIIREGTPSPQLVVHGLDWMCTPYNASFSLVDDSYRSGRYIKKAACNNKQRL